MSGTVRDIGFERMWTIQAGESVRVNVDELVTFAEQRSGDGLVRDLDTRDFGREVREELADARNYLVWYQLQVSARVVPDGELTELIGRALASVAEAFDFAHRARLRQAGA